MEADLDADACGFQSPLQLSANRMQLSHLTSGAS
jgi:hypothetical protein